MKEKNNAGSSELVMNESDWFKKFVINKNGLNRPLVRSGRLQHASPSLKKIGNVSVNICTTAAVSSKFTFKGLIVGAPGANPPTLFAPWSRE